MRVLLAESFFESLLQLPSGERDRTIKAIKTLKRDPNHPSINLHPVKASKDNFYTARASKGTRLVLHLNKDEILVCISAKHDDAYRYACTRRIKKSVDGSEIVSIVETQDSTSKYTPSFPPPANDYSAEAESKFKPDKPQVALETANRPIFAESSDADLKRCGLDDAAISEVRTISSEPELFLLEAKIGSILHENLLALYLGEELPYSPDDVSEFKANPELKFIEYDDTQEVLAALEKPWERWLVFLSRTQKRIVSSVFSGPSKVFGGAGTGKTVVALHRAKHLIENGELASSRGVGLLTFSRVLANDLEDKADLLFGMNSASRKKLHITYLDALAHEVLESAIGKRFALTTDYTIRAKLTKLHEKFKLEQDFTPEFVISEYMNVVGPWGLWEFEQYKNFPRIGRLTPLGVQQRRILSELYSEFNKNCHDEGLISSFQLYQKATLELKVRNPVFDHVIIDETQDLGPSMLDFVRNLVLEKPDDIMLCGDSGQSLYTRHHSFKKHGLKVQGRSRKLRVNYRTSRQIKETADKINQFLIELTDNANENRRSLSIFDGPTPEIKLFESRDSEAEHLLKWIKYQLGKGIQPHETIVITPNHAAMKSAEKAILAAGIRCWRLSATANYLHGEVGLATPRRIKGLEYRSVAIIGCDEGEFPNEKGFTNLGDSADSGEYLVLEKNSFYVAMTRARDNLLITGISPGSLFLNEVIL